MVVLMESQVEIIELPIKGLEPKILCMMMPVRSYQIEEVQLAVSDEVATFATDKRKAEHLSGRLLLEYALVEWGMDVSLIEVRRNEFRAPSIAYLPGTWLRAPLPSISLSHSSGWAFVALIEPNYTVGIDAELSNLKISQGVFDMMAKGEELQHLQENPNTAVELWTSKESIQKSLRKGMHFNPREIKIPIGESPKIISIENSIFKLVNLTKLGFQIGLSFGLGKGYDRIHEDDLLDETRDAMNSTDDWTVGCKTTSSNM